MVLFWYTSEHMTTKIYQPSPEILEKYADLIVRFGMQSKTGKKLKRGSVIQFTVPEAAKPLYFYLQRAILKQGHHPLGIYVPSSDITYNLVEDFYNYASKTQRTFIAKKYVRGLVDQIDGSIHILAETNPHALKAVDAKKIMQKAQAQKPGISYRRKKIEADKLCWTIALYGTPAMAKEAGLSLKAYWNQIIKACYLDTPDPVKEWHTINKIVTGTAKKLTKLRIASVHVKGIDVDITLGIGANRKWLAGGGCNIPSFEVFTTPMWQSVNGWIRLNQPHFRYGKKIEGIQLWFKDGVVIKSVATKNHDLLQSMLKTPGGNKLGEFSLTDSRLSRVTKFMAEILYDENIGGKYGNTHIALGSAYRECFDGELNPTWKNADWDALGFNNSVVHSDVISTTDRTVTATLQDGSQKIIYQNGQFTV